VVPAERVPPVAPPAGDADPHSRLQRLIRAFLVLTPAIVPMVYSPHSGDLFRLPKELFVRADAIALLALMLIGWLLSGRWPRREVLRDPIVAVALAATLWTALATLASPNRTISAHSLIWVASLAVFVCAMRLHGPFRYPGALTPLLLSTVPNVVVFLLQDYQRWNPFFSLSDVKLEPSVSNLYSTALIGNPDDYGIFLVAPAVAAATAFFVDGRRRWLFGPIAAALMVAVCLSHCLTAMLGYFAAVLVLLVIWSWRYAFAAAIVLPVAALASARLSPGLQYRLQRVVTAVEMGNLDFLLTGRLTAWASALLMGKSHPLLGVGPGRFGAEYAMYKIPVESRFPQLAVTWSSQTSFGQAHNDYLQALAVAGIPGLLLFVAALLVLLPWRGRANLARAKSEDEATRIRYGNALSMSLAVAFGVIALAQFPLELAAPLVTFLYVALLAIDWRTADA
jgi:O-antigen ligase